MKLIRVIIKKNLLKEGSHIKATKCVNRQVAGRTQHKWKQDNPEKAREYYEKGKTRTIAYYHEHKEETIEKRRLKEEKKYNNAFSRFNVRFVTVKSFNTMLCGIKKKTVSNKQKWVVNE